MKSVKCYHGTNERFSQFDRRKARIVNDFYGGGVAYFTESLKVAKEYAAAAFRRNGGDRFVYECNTKFSKLFDVDDVFTGKELTKLVGNDPESFARGAGLLRLGDNRIAVINKLKSGNINLTGAQVFKGMSNGMINTARAREKLIKAGYDGLRYNGGEMMGGERHSVYLAYDPDNVQISQRYIVTKEPLENSSPRETYTFIN